jgi:hypothetical protein
MTNTYFDPKAGGSITFPAPIVDYVKFGNHFLVLLANGKVFESTDGMHFYEVTITINRLK